MLFDKIIHASDLRGAQYFFIAGERAAQGNVLFDRAANQPDVLQHHAQGAAQIRGVDLAHVYPVNQHRARIRLVEPEDELGDRGFARADLANNGHFFFGCDLERHILQRRFGRARVGEGDVSELDGALKIGPRHEHPAVLVLALLPHQAVQRSVADGGLVHAGQQLGDLCHGCNGPSRQNGAGNDGTKAKLPRAHQKSAHRDHRHLHKLLGRVGHVGGELRQHARLKPHVGLVRHRLLPAPAHQRTRPERLDGLQAIEGFNQDGVLVVPVFLRLLDQALELGLHRQAREQHDGDGDQWHISHGAANQPDDDQKHNGKGDVDKGGERGGGQEIPDRLKFFEGAGQRAGAATAGLHVGIKHLLKQGISNGGICLGAGHVQKIAAHGANGKVTDKDNAHADQEGNEGVDGVVGDHAVIDDHREN